MLIAAKAAAFKPAAGAWDRRGATHVRLAAVDATLRSALTMPGATPPEGTGGEANGVMATPRLR
jgi:hypothetical protein